MRWFTRLSVGLALALCAWVALPGGTGAAAPKPPEVHSVIEGRDGQGQPLVIVIGNKVKAFKKVAVQAIDESGVRPPYNREGTIVVRSGRLSVFRLPEGIEAEWGADDFALVFTYGRKNTLLPVNTRLDFGAAAPDTVRSGAIQNASIDVSHLQAGLLADLSDADTLNGFDSGYFNDAGNLTGTLDAARFSAWDDLLNDEARVGTSAGQLAPGDHTHAIGDGLQRTAGILSVTFSGAGSTPFAARSDHDHSGVFAPAFNAGSGLDLASGTLSVIFGGTGGASSSARSDHNHDLAYATAAHTHDNNYFTRQDLSNIGIVNSSTNPVDWSKLKNVPLGFADGVDSDTTYTAGSGLVVSNDQFRADFAGGGSATTVARSDHDHAGQFADTSHTHDTRYATLSRLADAAGVVNSATNPVSWTQLKDMPTSFADGADSDTTYAAGTGLNLSSGSFSVNFAGTGTAATAARSDHDHTGVFSLVSHEHDTRYTLKSTLADAGGSLNDPGNPVDWSQLKNMPAAFADGVDEGSSLAAGAGLDITGETLSVVFSGTGAASSVSRADHDHTGTYAQPFAAGNGLVLSSGTLSVGFGGDGIANTVSRSDHDHDTSYYTKTQLNSVGAINTAGNPVDWSQLKNVPADFADGTDASLTYTAGDGLSLNTDQFSVNYAGSTGDFGTATNVSRSDHTHTATLIPNSWTFSTGYIAIRTANSNNCIQAESTEGIAVKGTNLSTQSVGVKYGVYGEAAAPNGRGVQGTATATTGTTYGVRGSASSANGFGVHASNAVGTALHAESSGATTVRAVNSTNGGTAIRAEGNGLFGVTWGVYATGGTSGGGGVYGASFANGIYGLGLSTNNAAVFGESQSVVAGVGVRGKIAGSSGYGVLAEAVGLGGTTYGVWGESQSTAGTGVRGQADATTGTTYGVYAESKSTAGTGVRGLTSANTGVTYGVDGQTSGSLGAGVRGQGIGKGVYGSSAGSTGIGVYGEVGHPTGTPHAVHGRSTARAGTGVFGENTDTNGHALAYGVFGITDSNAAAGVCGVGSSIDTTTGRGVHGMGATGVQGTAAGSTGTAVYGLHSATTGAGRGLHGRTDSSSGAGVYAQSNKGGASSVALLVDHTDSGTTTGNLAIFKDQGANVARIDRSGQGIFNGGTATSGADFAESVAINAPKADFEPGDVIVIDTEGTRRFAMSKQAESPTVAGIYSTRPGVLARPGDVANSSAWRDKEIPLAITGIVPCKVSGEGGAIKAGDLLVSAAIAGHAKKAPENAKQGTIVAKALGAFDGKTGKIEVLITMR